MEFSEQVRGIYAFSPYGSSFSPSPECKTKGVLSSIKSFTKYDLSDIINGGPLTLEIHDTVFRNDDGIKNLIVRVWGWSGYFNELDLVYQNHIIKRLEFLN